MPKKGQGKSISIKASTLEKMGISSSDIVNHRMIDYLEEKEKLREFARKIDPKKIPPQIKCYTFDVVVRK